MSKPVIFLSHIHEERELAIALNSLIEASFLGMVDVFVASDGSSIGMGDRWLQVITEKLRSSFLEIILCSPASVTRPWVNFEAGAGWIREDLAVVPLCHSGMTPRQLPVPLNLLQAGEVNSVDDLRDLVTQIARKFGSAVPPVDYDTFVKEVRSFEERYTFWDQCNASFSVLLAYFPAIVTHLVARHNQDVIVREEQKGRVAPALNFLSEHEVISVSHNRQGGLDTLGSWSGYTIEPASRTAEVVADSRFAFRLTKGAASPA